MICQAQQTAMEIYQVRGEGEGRDGGGGGGARGGGGGGGMVGWGGGVVLYVIGKG